MENQEKNTEKSFRYEIYSLLRIQRQRETFFFVAYLLILRIFEASYEQRLLEALDKTIPTDLRYMFAINKNLIEY